MNIKWYQYLIGFAVTVTATVLAAYLIEKMKEAKAKKLQVEKGDVTT